ncbi:MULTISPECIES: carbohydrate kinase family protein [Clostridium]|uniref:Carbohydrate kinase n=1 Tax=Clostridium frigoriphilum TaxID=443253 RepID=A0ABU7UUV6_9CLOT|nr:carbohydrate kinase [Clostridium sp. DSM 17811]MBU3102203.1 carbohydrate kinase [Clostridium sp. DSM 17811]
MINFYDTFEFENKNIDVFTIGELLVDMISSDYSEDFQCSNYVKYFGGSPANIAMNVKKLGANSTIASSIGKDGLGDFLKQHLEGNCIDTSFISRVDFPTSMVLVTKSKTTPKPIFYRGADYNLEYTPEIEIAVQNSKIIHFSCWPISQKTSRSTIEKVIIEARKNGVIIGFDPNYHEMIWEKEHDGIEYIKQLISKVDIVKPSEDDANRIFGEDTPQNQIDKFIKLGAKLVIMTLGSKGAIVSNGSNKITFDSLASKVIDTTGAGDAFWSGFYTALIKGYPIKVALELGFAVSAYKLKYVGAVVNLPSIEEIKNIYNI